MTVYCKRFGSSTQIIIPNFRYLSLRAPSPGNAKLVSHFCEKRLSWDFSFLHLVWLESESSKVTNKYISDYHHHYYYSWSNSNFFKTLTKAAVSHSLNVDNGWGGGKEGLTFYPNQIVQTRLLFYKFLPSLWCGRQCYWESPDGWLQMVLYILSSISSWRSAYC